MDSISQLVLGSAIGVAVMGRKTSVGKAALVGAIAGTLPDLDVFINYGDAIKNMTYHRATSHSLLYLLLLSPFLGWLTAKLFHQQDLWRHWTLAILLGLITHPILDMMTIYGTQLGIPWTNHPFAIGSIFIIDPLYTLPLVLGVGLALGLRSQRGKVANDIGLILSTSYLIWSFLAQQWVLTHVKNEWLSHDQTFDQVIVTPMPLNTLLWRVVGINANGYVEGHYSLLERNRPMQFTFYPRDKALYKSVSHNWYVQRIAWFTQGMFKVTKHNEHVIITDLRMGGGACYTFAFDLGEVEQVIHSDNLKITPIRKLTDIPYILKWMRHPDWDHLPWKC